MDAVMKWIETLGGATLLIGIVYFASKKIIETLISKALEEYKSSLTFETKKREKATLVAELLSEWVKIPMDTAKVNRLLWEATLWLPDKEAKDLNDLLAHTGNKSTKEILIDIRNILQEKECALTANDLTHF